MEFLFSDGNYPFAVALVLMLIIAVLEGVLVVIGLGLSQFIDGLLPDVDLSADGEVPNMGLSRFLAWLRIGQVPVLIILVLLLMFFGLSGVLLQSLLMSAFGFMLPALVAVVPALAIALPLTRLLTGLLGKVLLKDETEAVSSASFIGQVATITLGEARQGSPAEARFRDHFGTTHYLMVEPDTDEIYRAGENVLLVQQRGAVYQCIRPDNKHLQ
ncbi:MAG: YqiJ family protein [Saccharospirillaceae bacterium]|nr:YqiJ family protein [Saccharospirillaceae bacterium]MCD8532542.1 YqiJ family protein [Saccharospirillaceae bacterium]